MKNTYYVIITPARNEEDHIEKTISSILLQSVKPAQWIIVDDGSSDLTFSIASSLCVDYPWIKVVKKPDRGYRLQATGVIDTFYFGFSNVSVPNWEFIVKLDGDMSFESDYFEKLFTYFRKTEQLGIAGGTICMHRNGHPVPENPSDPVFHVRGATKVYRRQCWEQIEPLIHGPGWDTVDELKANMHGWETRTIKDIQILHHKPTGSVDGQWRNYFKNGLANYVTGYHPFFLLMKCIKRLVQKPVLIGSLALACGFVSGYFSSVSPIDDKKLIKYIRRQQMNKLFLRSSIWTYR